MSPEGLHRLIDGVFAIAVTLLVLDLPKPADSERLAHDLLDQWPAFAAYVVSFATVGVVWIEHHGMMSAVRRVDLRFLESTLFFLAFVSLVPWPTALAAEYAERGSQATPAAVLYAGVMGAMSLAFALSWRYLERHPDLVVEPARKAFTTGTRRAALGALGYGVAIAVAFVSPMASFAFDAAIGLYFALSRSEVAKLIARGTWADTHH